MENYAKLLLERKYKIGIWGAGYIGFSTMAYFARNGVTTLAAEVIPSKVDAVNCGDLEIVGLQNWLGFDVRPLAQNGLIRATLNHDELLDGQVLVHFIAIPTEKNGKPYNQYLEDVITKIAKAEVKKDQLKPLVIIESTLTPGTTDKVIMPIFNKYGKTIGKDILLGIAPRRDWFVDNTKSLKELDRVYGGVDEMSTLLMKDVLGIVCDRLHSASSHRSVEIVKSCENAYRHMEITLANQISLAYPNINVREVLKLVGTKWNIGTFYPGFGSGGYCIPLSSQYVLLGAEHPEELSILSNTIKTDTDINKKIAQSIISRGYKNVGVMGLSYKANLKVWILSPTLPFIEELKRNNISVKLHDPYYTDEEIQKIADVQSFDFPKGLNEFDAVVAIVDHREFVELSDVALTQLKKCRFVLDNMGMWQDNAKQFQENGIEYHIAGDANWLLPKYQLSEAN